MLNIILVFCIRHPCSLQTQTAGVAVSYFDRYVSKVDEKGLCQKSVQLLAITCVLIAAKLSEIKMPGLDD